MLKVRGIDVCYGRTQVIWDLSIEANASEVVAVMGPNGSGKSTLFKAIIGLVKPTAGVITFEGQDLNAIPTHRMSGIGIGLVLERRRLFNAMTVRENLVMGAYRRAAQTAMAETLDWVESLFPMLRERRGQRAGSLSGGEQQMVAIARGLMSRPKLLMMDEPFLGLAPRVVDLIVDTIQAINRAGIAVLFNEQNANLSLAISDRGYLLESGRLVLAGSGTEMLEHQTVRRVYLGV